MSEYQRVPYWDYMLEGGQGDREMKELKVGSTWVAKRDYPLGADLREGEEVVVEGFGYDLNSVVYRKRGDNENWYGSVHTWSSDFKQSQDTDQVNHPSHYNESGVECIDAIRATLGPEGFQGIESDGGPSPYYDFLPGWKTWNDFADHKAKTQWKEFSFHLGNVGKSLCRWGDKNGTTKTYDARKIVYSGLRILMMLEGKNHVRKYLEDLLEDGQFRD